MSKWQSPLMQIGLAVVIALGIAQTVATQQMNQRIQSLGSSMDTLLETAGEPRLPIDFEAAIATGIEHHLEARQAAKVAEKYAVYQAAEESMSSDSRFYGPLDARFTLVTYSDLECPYCKRFHSTPKKVVDAGRGLINWQWKHMPLGFHNPAANISAQAAECVAAQKGNRGFWVMLDELFANSQGNGSGVPDIVGLAEGVGADRQAFKNCLDAGTYAARVAEEAQRGDELGVTGTPATFVVDNRTGETQLVTGAQPEQAFVAVIKGMIAQSQADQS